MGFSIIPSKNKGGRPPGKTPEVRVFYNGFAKSPEAPVLKNFTGNIPDGPVDLKNIENLITKQDYTHMDYEKLFISLPNFKGLNIGPTLLKDCLYALVSHVENSGDPFIKLSKLAVDGLGYTKNVSTDKEQLQKLSMVIRVLEALKYSIPVSIHQKALNHGGKHNMKANPAYILDNNIFNFTDIQRSINGCIIYAFNVTYSPEMKRYLSQFKDNWFRYIPEAFIKARGKNYDSYLKPIGHYLLEHFRINAGKTISRNIKTILENTELIEKFNKTDFTRFRGGFIKALDNLKKLGVLDSYKVKPNPHMGRNEFITNGNILFEPDTKLKKGLKKLRKPPKY